MPPALLRLSFPGILVAEIDWLGTPAIALGLILIGLLIWQLWLSRTQYAQELAEHAQQIAEAREQAAAAHHESATLARENKAKGEMIATLSRDIRSHLNGIMGAADLLLDHSLKPRQRENLATLRASAESLHQSLNDVLDYASIETGRIQIAHTEFELRQPLIEVVETLAPLAQLKGLELVLIVAPDVPARATGDSARLRQVLLNLMSNAVKFTAQGRVVLRLTPAPATPVEPKPGTTALHFSVTDSGTGIPESMQATIFDRATESDTASPRNFGSSGLELAISKRLVELMGGKIGARPLPEGGTEFSVELALPTEKSAAPARAASTARMHVVVLDDLAAARVGAAAMLTALGIDQDATEGVAKAGELLRDAAEAGAAQLVLLLDDSVARDHGDELTQMLSADPALRATRVVLLTREPETVAASKPVEPIARILRKPLLRPEHLLEALGAGPATATTSSQAPFPTAGEPKPTKHRGPHVLVVDDDNISRSVSSQLLEILGCEVALATSGPEAIECARPGSFELILMDCQMPNMDGYEATRRILAASQGKAPPIVAVTANTSDSDRAKCFAAGMSDFVAKPVHKADLAQVLRRWIPAEQLRAK